MLIPCHSINGGFNRIIIGQWPVARHIFALKRDKLIRYFDRRFKCRIVKVILKAHTMTPDGKRTQTSRRWINLNHLAFYFNAFMWNSAYSCQIRTKPFVTAQFFSNFLRCRESPCWGE